MQYFLGSWNCASVCSLAHSNQCESWIQIQTLNKRSTWSVIISGREICENFLGLEWLSCCVFKTKERKKEASTRFVTKRTNKRHAKRDFWQTTVWISHSHVALVHESCPIRGPGGRSGSKKIGVASVQCSKNAPGYLYCEGLPHILRVQHTTECNTHCGLSSFQRQFF